MDCIFMQKNLLIFPLHIKILMIHIVCNHLVAKDSLFLKTMVEVMALGPPIPEFAACRRFVCACSYFSLSR